MDRWQYFVMFWLSVFFIADIHYNQCEHLEALCLTLVTSIVATMIPYFMKSYFETKAEKMTELYKSEGLVADTLEEVETFEESQTEVK